MKKFFTLSAILLAAGLPVCAQSAFDAYLISQPDMKGTARFMSMAGAFGALGGDLSCLSQNPGGIGVYRSNEVGFTLDLDCQRSTTNTGGFSNSVNQQKFYLTNIGGVATLPLRNSAVPNLNIGFTYNKGASFYRKYSGYVPNLNVSLSNYIAGIANTCGLNEADVKTTNSFNPYQPNDGYPGAPWITILGYDSYLITPEGNSQNPEWYGQFGNGTKGTATFGVNERGSLDEYNIALGGNIADVVFWGMNFDIVSMDYRIESLWNENLQDAYVYDPYYNRTEQMDANWTLQDRYRLNGTGFNYQLGVIVKPIQELRLGLAFHTPTYYKLTETFYNEHVTFRYPFLTDEAYTDDGIPGYNNVNFNSPWKVIASAAGVIGGRFIVSADYEWNGMKGMNYTTPSYYDDYYDPWYDYLPYDVTTPMASYDDDPEGFTNQKIKEIYQNTSTFRIGAECRITSRLSARVGYSYTSSPVTNKTKKGLQEVPGAGIMTNFRLDNSTNYVTCGLGYKYRGFYVDAAYVYKHISSDYYPFTPDPADPMAVPNSKLSLSNSQILLSMGLKF